MIDKTEILQNLLRKYSSFAFLPELFKAEIGLYGQTSRINIPFVYTETLEECEKEISHTYEGDNIYFSPKNIIIRLKIYCENLFALNISKKDKTIILKKIFSSLLLASTYEYREIMKNKSICSHHAISTKNISKKQLIINAFNISKFFLISDIPIGIHIKITICFISNFKIAYLKLTNVFK